jgi:hypothetical protein
VGSDAAWAVPGVDGRKWVTLARQLVSLGSRPRTPRPGWRVGGFPHYHYPHQRTARSVSCRSSKSASLSNGAGWSGVGHAGVGIDDLR